MKICRRELRFRYASKSVVWGFAGIVVVVISAVIGCDAPDRVLEGPAQLRISLDGEEEVWTIRERATVVIDGAGYRVEAIRPWGGLLRGGTGSPMAMVSLQAADDAWIEDIVLADGVWADAGAGATLRFRWHDSEAAFEEALAAAFDPADGARWGVRDGASIQWSNTFLPGVGVEISDGSSVTLGGLEREGDVPVLEFIVEQNGVTDSRRIRPGSDEEDAIVFEAPGLGTPVVHLEAWRDGEIAVRVFPRNGEAAAARLVEGETWMGPVGVRLEQAMSGGALVKAEESPYFEAVLAGSSRRYRLREGESVRIGEARVQFYYDAEQAESR